MIYKIHEEIVLTFVLFLLFTLPSQWSKFLFFHHFLSVCGIYFSHFLQFCLLSTNYFSFPSSKNFLIFSLFLKGSFIGYRIHGSQLFSSSTCKMLCHFLLTSVVLYEKSAIQIIFSYIYVISLWLLLRFVTCLQSSEV